MSEQAVLSYLKHLNKNRHDRTQLEHRLAALMVAAAAENKPPYHFSESDAKKVFADLTARMETSDGWGQVNSAPTGPEE